MSTKLPGTEQSVVGSITRGTMTWYQGQDINGDPENPVDLTGYTAQAQIRRTRAEADPALVDISTVSNATGVITLGGVAGTIDWEYTPTSTVEGEGWLFMMLTEPGGDTVELFHKRIQCLAQAVR